MTPVRDVVVHGHFYQPPREDPWTGTVPVEPTAAPFPDWNARITAECYAPFAAARVLDATGAVAHRVDLYAWGAFDVGPTLATWLDRHAPDVTAAMVAGDRASVARLGHGNALAHPYHHVILPLASPRDRAAELRWGIADFVARFGRRPDGLWLPETAVDEPTLVALADAGIAYTVLAPHQVETPSADGTPLAFDAGGGRVVAVFTYDGALAGGVAFGDLLRDGERLAAALAGDGTPGVASLATDGETFGHHHRWGEMALARAITSLRDRPGVRVANWGAALAARPPRGAARLIAPSSWSCAHGVERWRADCGCALDRGRWRSQAWRAPLRAALEWLAAELRAGADPTDEALDRGIARLFTSCAWFFDDLGRIEVLIVLRYARWAMERAGRLAELEPAFTRRLAAAVSNDPAVGDGVAVYAAAQRQRAA